MEKVLKLYTYIDGVNDTPFPNEEHQVITSDFRSDYKRMGGVPTISCSIMHPLCLDKMWTDNVYATFNGEKFFIKQVPTSSYDNTDARYKHELELVSERIILDNVYVYDVVTSDTTNDKPVSNSSKFTFFGTIHEYAERLNRSLEYSGLDYRVVVDEGISSEGKMVSFENQFFSNAIQESYNTYEIPYYYVGKVIHIGFTDNAITKTFKYGQDESLLSIQKQNANYKIVNRVTGVGSADNIPYYYPNDYESKEEVEANGGTWINPQPNLMPSIYRDTLGKERFYKALNDTYISPQTGTYYEFENPFIEGKPKEHIVNFEDIKPSIVGMVNSNGLRIDMFSEFAYDLNDNDETDEEGNYLHPYFFGKLRKFDGEYGFNLFDHAIDEDEMVISMTSGNCGACEFVIGVDEDAQKNPVQVDEYGNLKRDSDGNVIRSGAFQDRQNDTQNYEVWIALKKDINTFGVIMPNATNNYKPSTNDTFVILHIDLPKAYILAAEDKLKEELIKYMAMNNSEKFNFSITFSRIFFAENPDILAQLNENARIQIEYDNELYELYVSSYSYNMSSDKPLPEIKVELSDTLTVTQNALQTAISEVKHDIMSSVGSIDWLQQGLRYFLRKDTNDRTRGKLSSDVALEVGNYVSGASGAIIYKDKETGQTVGEMDKLYIRMKAYFETLEIVNVNTVGGKQILSPGGSVKCIGVERIENAYRCYFLAEQDGEKVQNRFVKDDQIYSQMFDAVEGESHNVSTHYLWRLCTNVSKESVEFEGKLCHYIDLSITDCDKDSDAPSVGDVLNQRGNRTDIDRMNFIEQSSVDTFSPNITLFHGVNSYSLEGKEYVSYGVDKSTNKAFMNVYGEMYVGDRQGGSYMRYTQEEGLEISGTLSVGTKLGDKDLQELINSATPEGYQEFVEKVTQDLEGLQNQVDGAIESYFYQYHPTLNNYPAMDWDTDDEKKAHLNDTFTSLVDGRSWRWSVNNGIYGWVEITDTATTQALALAGQAQDTADGKRRVFVDTPKPPYDKGDLWSRGSDYPLMICVNKKDKNGVYEASDFDYADNNAKLKEEMQGLVNDTKDELNNAIGQAQEAANKYADQGISEAQQSLNDSIAELNKAKANVTEVYSKAEADNIINNAEQDAINAAKKQADAAIALSETIIKAYADDIVDEEEQARIAQAEANLKAAKEYADQKAQEAFNEINGYEYLKVALNEAPYTQVRQGLVLTSLIQMRNTSGNILSGLNGLYGSKGEKSIATWWGGEMNDLVDYYDWNGGDWVAKSGVTIPSSLPSGLIRFDGTGYLAKGKFWWDSEGKIYADPTALFLMFDVEDEAKSLSSTILSMLDKQTEFEDMWSIKTDASGNKYAYSKYPLVSQQGITMYADSTTLNLPSIYDGIPIDGDTIYWSNGVLKSKGGTSGSSTLGGLSNVGSWADSVADVDRIMYQAAGSSNWVAKSLSSIGGGGGSFSGGVITGSGYNVLVVNRTDRNRPTIGFQYDGSLYGYFGFANADYPVFISSVGDAHQILHANNYSSYALPLTGGTITSSQRTPLTLASTYGVDIFLELKNTIGITTRLGKYQTFSFFSNLYGGENRGELQIHDDGSFKYSVGTNIYTIWHSGNDGAGSGLDADLLDGQQGSWYQNNVIGFKHVNIAALSSSDRDVNNLTNGILYNYGSASYWVNAPSNMSYGSILNLRSGSVYSLGGQLAWDINHGSTTDTTRYLWWRATDQGDWIEAKWHQIAFTDSNVASATKLQTARTIWGKSFDGTGNVTGDIYTSSHSLVGTYGGAFLYSGIRSGEALSIEPLDGSGTWLRKGITLLQTGYVGMNTLNPKNRLSVYGGVSSVPALGSLVGEGLSVGYSGSYGIHLYTLTNGMGAIQCGREDGNATAYSLLLNPLGGNVGIGTTSPSAILHVAGDILATGGITMYSDQRKKTILNHVELSLKQIANAPLIEHYYNGDDKKTTHVGSIAQYWAGLNDWFCKKDSEGFYTMEIQNAALASAISVARELDRYESKTDKKIKQLKKRICQLEDELERLKSA